MCPHFRGRFSPDPLSTTILTFVVVALLLSVTSSAVPARTSGRRMTGPQALVSADQPLLGAPRVGLTLNPAYLHLGGMSILTGIVQGGTPWFNYSWTTLPPGCTSTNSSRLDCTPAEAGTFTVTLLVTDSLGRTGSNTSLLQVNSTSASSPGPLSSLTYLFAGVMGTVAAVATAAVFIFYWGRRRRRSPPVAFSKTPYVPPEAFDRP